MTTKTSNVVHIGRLFPTDSRARCGAPGPSACGFILANPYEYEHVKHRMGSPDLCADCVELFNEGKRSNDNGSEETE